LLNYPHFRQGIAYELRRVRNQGIARLPSKLAKRAIGVILWLVLLPVTAVLHLAGYRRLTVFTERIGHLALEPDCLLKEQALGLVPKRRWFLLAPLGRVANRHLLNYWKPLIRVYEGRVTCFILASMTNFGLMRHDVSKYLLGSKSQTAYRVFALWRDRPPLLALTRVDEEWGAQALLQMGLPEHAWFVCVHVREPGFSPIDEELQAHRNGSIGACIPAIKEIARRGGWVVRIGDPTMEPLPQLPQVIDYAHHSMKCERLDVILCAKARFILGNTSGIALVCSAFGVPCAAANTIPFPTLWFSHRDVSIPKLLWSEELGRHLRFDEILESPVAQFRYASLYADARIRVDENSADDIKDLVFEMLERLDGTFSELAEDGHRSLRFRSLFRRDHCGVDSSARNGALFLRKYAHLLGEFPLAAPTRGSVSRQ
jgi:putative glycosyltransferase (TIGR04372 family)